MLEGYEEFRAFNPHELKLIEPLRALRYIHYATWIARRWHDGLFKRPFHTLERFNTGNADSRSSGANRTHPDDNAGVLLTSGLRSALTFFRVQQTGTGAKHDPIFSATRSYPYGPWTKRYSPTRSRCHGAPNHWTPRPRIHHNDGRSEVFA